MKHLHFISGLPRAGTTLLASILRQNPAVHASIMSPIGQVVTDAVTAMGELRNLQPPKIRVHEIVSRNVPCHSPV